jgi:hypothetical protein
VRLLQVATAIGGRNPGAATSTQRPAAAHARSSAFTLGRPSRVHLAVSLLSLQLDAITIVRPETVVRWQRMGFAVYWRWKSRPPGGRPRIDKEIRDLIQRMSLENRLWGATKIHGELLKLGIEIAQSTVSITWCRGEIGHCKLGRPSFAISNIIATHVSDFSEATPAKACSTGRSGGSRSSNYC